MAGGPSSEFSLNKHPSDLAPATNPPRPAVFHVHGVSKTYRVGEVEVQALRGVELDLYQGELVVLLGASGSGKSTLLNILGGLDVPSDGEVYYLDHKLTGAGEEELTRFRREHVGFVFQFYNLIPSLTALENVSLAICISARGLRSIPGSAVVIGAKREEQRLRSGAMGYRLAPASFTSETKIESENAAATSDRTRVSPRCRRPPVAC